MNRESAWSWDATCAFVASKGYTEHFRVGNAPHSDQGTLHYFKRPNDPLNLNGMPRDYATLMYHGGRWLAAFFERNTKPRLPLMIVGGTDYGD